MTARAKQPDAASAQAVGASRWIRRPALIERLEAAAAGPVTVVAAAAGSGKTVLIRSWLQARGADKRAAWVSVERDERDAQRFWNAVVAELRAAAPPGVEIEALAPTPAFDGEAAVARLVSELAALEDRLVLVIDDVHEIASAEVLRQLSHFLDRLPQALHVVLISRRDPQLGLHRRRIEGELHEVRSEQLKFTLEETREMLQALGIELSDDGLKLLHERTEGWVAGLRLAAVSLAAHSDPERFVLDFSGSERTVSEYLLAEVLESQQPQVRRLLVRASLLERVNGALGDLLTGGSGSEYHLRALADAGAFVVALDPERTWFRFHHLFADLLAVELRHSEPEELARLHLAASGWFGEHGYHIEAIAHAQAAGDSEQAAGLLIEHYFSLALDGRQATAHALVESYTRDPALASSAEIATMVAADQLYGGSLEQAATQIALAERQAAAVPEHRRHRFEMALLVTRLALARQLGDFRSVLEDSQPSRILIDPRDSVDVSMYNDVRALVLMNIGIVEVWSGRIEDGARHLEEASHVAEQIGRPYLVVGCSAHLAQALSWRSFTRAREACRDAITLAEGHGWGSDPVIGPAVVTLATALVHAGRLDEARQWLERADVTVHPEVEPAVGCLLHMAHGVLHHLSGRHAESIERYLAAQRLGLQLIDGSPLVLELECALLHARLRAGEISAVSDALANMPVARRDTGAAREVLAELALALGDPRSAIAVLAPTLSGELESEYAVVAVSSHLLSALAHEALGEALEAEREIERALGLAEPDGLIVCFLYIDCRELIERHPRHRTAHGAFLAEVLDVLSGGTPAASTRQRTGHIDALSDAELRVLRYLPTNLPAAAIAGEIYVSTNTVKTHMRHIYAKLGAHTRREAVAVARELGLLGRSALHD